MATKEARDVDTPEYPCGSGIVVPCKFLPLKYASSTLNPSISTPKSLPKHQTQPISSCRMYISM